MQENANFCILVKVKIIQSHSNIVTIIETVECKLVDQSVL